MSNLQYQPPHTSKITANQAGPDIDFNPKVDQDYLAHEREPVASSFLERAKQEALQQMSPEQRINEKKRLAIIKMSGNISGLRYDEIQASILRDAKNVENRMKNHHAA